MNRPHQTLGLVLGLIAVTAFGGSLPATRLAVLGLDPWFVTAARAAIAGIVAAALIAMVRPRFPVEHLAMLVCIALFLVVGFPAALAIASVTVPSSHGGVILGLLPLSTTVGAVVLAGERPSLWFWLLSIAGALLVAAFALREGDATIVTGDIFLALAMIFTGAGYTLSGMLSRTLPAWQVIAWALALSLPPALAASIVLFPADPGAVALSAWGGLAYSGIVTQFIAYAIWNAALARGGVARIGQLQLLQPFVTFALSAAFLGETVTPAMVIFAIAIAVIVALGRRAAIRVPGLAGRNARPAPG